MSPDLAFALLACALPSAAHQAAQGRPDQHAKVPQFEERIEVVGVTPIHGTGMSRFRVPANVQVFTADRIGTSLELDVPTLLARRASSVHISEVQGGTFQPDLLFRGFVASPLLGASEGLAVYQDGVRVNGDFGDTMNWDALTPAAIASINVMPGSNPLFGLNALGGALSLQTKDGFGFEGGRAYASTGSFGRHQVEGEYGGNGNSFGYFVAGSLTDEAGWRDHSPSTLRQVFGDASWRGSESSLNANVTAAFNDMTGNGAAPVRLLEQRREGVFTHPDRTDTDHVLLTVRGRRTVGSATILDAVAYYRHSRTGTFNGDAADGDDDDGGGGAPDVLDEEGDGAFSAVNNRSATHGHAAGVSGQMTRTTPMRGRENHLIMGAGIDHARTRFNSSAEWAHLLPDRGTHGSGLFDEEAFVSLHSRTTTASVFVTDTWSLSHAVSVTGSARFNVTAVRLRDQIGTELSGDHTFQRVNPAAGLTYQMRPGVNLYASYAQSSRVPTPVELTCADPEDPCRLPNAFVSDPPLNQIVAGTWEAGARGRTGRVNWNVSTFTTAASDDIIFVSSGTLRGEGHFENIERTRRSGLEAGVEYEEAGRFSAFGAYTMLRATFGTDLRIASPFHPMAESAEIVVRSGSRLPGVPTHSGKAGIAAFVTAGLHLGVTVSAQSPQYLRGDEANLLSQLPGFAIVNAQARQRIGRRIAAVAQVRNVFDSAFYTFGVLGEAVLLGDEFENEPRFYSPGAPRALWIGLDVRF